MQYRSRVGYALLLTALSLGALWIGASLLRTPIVQAAGDPVFDNWRETPNLQVIFFWNLESRRDGKYAEVEWPEAELTAADTLLFGLRQVYLDMQITEHITENHDNGVWVEINNTVTNFPDKNAERNIHDYPPHVNAHLPWRNPAWSGDTNSHIYTGEDGAVVGIKMHYTTGDCPTGEINVQPGAWVSKRDSECRVVYQERFTETGELQLRLGEGSSIYTLRANAPGDLDILLDDELIYNVKRAFFDASVARMVWEISDYRQKQLVTETIVADPETGAFSEHSKKTSPLPASALPTPTPTPAAGETSRTDQSSGRIYHVSPDGDDDHPGTESQPWRTLAKAAAKAEAGQTVYIHEGTYREQLRPENSGAEGAYVTFMAYPGHTVVLDGGADAKQPSAQGVIDIYDRRYIRISGLTVINGGYYGIRVQKSQHIIIENNRTDFTYASGIFVNNSQHVVIDGNDIQRACHGIGGDPPHFAPNEHLTIRDTQYFEVMNNRVHQSHMVDGKARGKEGINIKTGSANGSVHHNVVDGIPRTGLYVDAYDRSIENIEIYANRVTHSLHGIVVASERGGPVSNVRIYQNFFAYNRYYGVWIAHYGDSGPLRGIEILTNTIYANQGHGIHITSTNLSGIVVRDNTIIAQRARIHVDSAVDPGSVAVEKNWVVDLASVSVH
ncbi:MAG TPA: right-handed parallel beta-helix repeat-containing protein [Caldilineaceae bacterium]|nr:right-handed parallel beta-helix repeat-containing protein [Caldilineaceae bacterium]